MERRLTGMIAAAAVMIVLFIMWKPPPWLVESSDGPNGVHSTAAACSSAAHAIGYAYNLRASTARPRRSMSRSLAIFEKALGPHHPDMAALLHNYALLLRAAGRPLEAPARAIWAKATR